YLNFDSEILLDLTNLGTITEKMVRTQYDNFIKRILFNPEIGEKASQELLFTYRNGISDVISKLRERETSNYEIEVTQSSLFGIEPVDTDLVEQTKNIINQQYTNNSYQQIDDLRSEIDQNITNIEENSIAYRSSFESNSTVFLTNQELFNDIIIQNLHNLFDGVHSTLDFSNLDAIQQELNDSGDVRALLGIPTNEIVNTSMTLLYMLETTQDFEGLHEFLDEITTDWNEIVQILGSRNETISGDLDNLVASFIQNITLASNEFQTEYDLVNSRILPSHRSELNLIQLALEFQYFPALIDMVELMHSMYISLTNMLDLIDNDLSYVIDQVHLRIKSTIITIDLENLAFSELFEEITTSARDRVNDLLFLTSTVLILGIVMLLLLIGFQLTRVVRGMQRDFAKLSTGNLTNLGKRRRYSSSEFGDMQRGFDSMVNNLHEILGTLQVSSERLAGISEELAAGSEEASASVNEVSETVREFSTGSSEQNLLLNRVMSMLDGHLSEVEKAARSIGEASYFVQKVAKRTNILGLNASIEASKAGKFGRGFNVVSEQVRNLSDDSKKSAKQIADLIEEVEFNIKNTIQEVLREVNITKEVAENTAAGSEQANAATSEQVVMLKEISTSSNEISLLAQELREITHRFTLD
ncbi:MAG: methyl-accepting chemotaxis protein, partial [Candidatus Kariarchaeaceae archaeon]